MAALTLVLGSAFVTWWFTTLSGLPDVGDPFDVQAFARTIPDDHNAFVLYKKATAILPDEPEIPATTTGRPPARSSVTGSKRAARPWRSGGKGPNGPTRPYVDPSTLTFYTKLDVVQSLRSLGRMALVEGSRLEDQGDYAGGRSTCTSPCSDRAVIAASTARSSSG